MITVLFYAKRRSRLTISSGANCPPGLLFNGLMILSPQHDTFVVHYFRRTSRAS